MSDRTSDIPSLVDPPEALLREFGLIQDSVARLRALLSAQGITATSTAGGSGARTTLGSAYLSTEWNFASASSLRFSVYASTSRNRNGGLAALSFPSLGTTSSRQNGRLLVQARTYFVGAIAEATASASLVESSTRPDRSGAVGVVPLGGIDGALSNVRFGSGAPEYSSRQRNFDLRAELSWIVGNGTHRPRVGAMLSTGEVKTAIREGFSGTYWYTSLDDLAVNQPASYRRIIGAATTTGRTTSMSAWVGDVWRAHRRLGIEAGLRLDHLALGAELERNAVVATQFGLLTDKVPSVTALVPRIGAALLLKERKTIRMRDRDGAMRTFEYIDLNAALGMPQGNVGTGVTLFGTFGAYPGAFGPARAAALGDRTGLPGTRRELACVGQATPRPDWSLNEGARFEECVDGTTSGSFAARQARVAAFGREFRPPIAWRANVGLAGLRFGQWQVGGGIVFSHTRAQESSVDLNLDRSTGFRLPHEGNRPVFVAPAEIDSRSGVIAPSASRIVRDYGAVDAIVSDLTSTAVQTRVTVLPPAVFNRLYFSLDYVRSTLNYDQRGSRGSTAGDPMDVERVSGAGAKHQFIAMTTTRVGKVDLGIRLNLHSGTRFTPMVSSDLNGDGLANDRAFVPGVASSPDALNEEFARFLSEAPTAVAKCLGQQVGVLANHNSCVGGWRAQLDLSADVRPPERLGLGSRLRVSVRFLNAGAALMRLAGLSGASAQGWQQQDERLLFVTGFDPSAQRYQYRVNPAFGRALESGLGARAFPPFQVQLGVEIALGGRVSQTITRQLGLLPEPGVKRDYASIQQALRGLMPSPAAKVLMLRDSLALDTKQQEVISQVDGRYMAKLDSLFEPAALVALEQQAGLNDAILMRAYAPMLEAAFAIRLAARDEVLLALSKDQIAKLVVLVEGWR